MEKPENTVKQCSECKSTFIRQSDMLRHIKRFHKNIADKLLAAIENQDRRFKCKQCNKRFFHKKNLHFHEKSHDTNNSGVKIRKKCPFCDHVAFFKKDFYDHCQGVHNITLNFEKMDFASVDDFMNWKNEIETSLHCKFLKEYGSTHKLSNYVCGRSKLLEENEDMNNIQDTIDGFCPAGIKVMHEDGKCSILFSKTHICRPSKNVDANIPTKTEKEVKPISKQTPQEVENTVNKSQEILKPKKQQDHGVKTVAKSASPQRKRIPKSTINNSNRKSFLNKKKEMIHNVLTTLNTINNTAELEAVQELIKPIQPIMELLRKKSGRPKQKTEVVKKSK